MTTKTIAKVWLAALTISLALTLVWETVISYTREAPETIPPNGVVGKYEQDDRYYLKLIVEVTPDEYITYDVGDEYGREQE